jgi:hypothetical protein
MNCPLILNFTGTLGTVDYFRPCECLKLCDLTKCKYRKCGFLVQFSALGTVTTDTVAIQAKACGGALPLVAASNNALVTNADLTVGAIYKVTPVTVDGILKGVVQGL